MGKKYENLDYSVRLEEFDCLERKCRTLLVGYYSRGDLLIESLNVEKPNWTFLLPETIDEELYNVVCK